MNTLPTIPEVLADPSASYWLKDALRSATHRDIIDALNDAEALLAIPTRSIRQTVCRL